MVDGSNTVSDVKLYWHPDFGAVLCMEADSGLDISDVLEGCPFTDGLSSKDVRFVKRRKGLWCLRGLHAWFTAFAHKLVKNRFFIL